MLSFSKKHTLVHEWSKAKSFEPVKYNYISLEKKWILINFYEKKSIFCGIISELEHYEILSPEPSVTYDRKSFISAIFCSSMQNTQKGIRQIICSFIQKIVSLWDSYVISVHNSIEDYYQMKIHKYLKRCSFLTSSLNHDQWWREEKKPHETTNMDEMSSD